MISIEIYAGLLPARSLVAYGLSPSRLLLGLQQQPMTIVMIDEVELALEASVARHVWVKRRRAAWILFEHKRLE